jgi:hypothetical protein
MMIQLNPAIPVTTAKGKGFAQVLIDYGMDFDLLWVVFISHTGECWTFKNNEVKAIDNITYGVNVASLGREGTAVHPNQVKDPRNYAERTD